MKLPVKLCKKMAIVNRDTAKSTALYKACELLPANLIHLLGRREQFAVTSVTSTTNGGMVRRKKTRRDEKIDKPS